MNGRALNVLRKVFLLLSQIDFFIVFLYTMPESFANIKREKNQLKSQVSTLTEEISGVKVLTPQQSSNAVPIRLKQRPAVLNS